MRPALRYRAFPVPMIWLSAQHLVGLEQTEDRHVHIFDAWEQQAGNQRRLNRYGAHRRCSSGVERSKADRPRRCQTGRRNTARRSAWSAPGCAPTASPPDAQNRLAEAARAFVHSQTTFCRHKGTFAPHAANLAAPEPARRRRFGWSSVSCQTPRPGRFRTESWSPSG